MAEEANFINFQWGQSSCALLKSYNWNPDQRLPTLHTTDGPDCIDGGVCIGNGDFAWDYGSFDLLEVFVVYEVGGNDNELKCLFLLSQKLYLTIGVCHDNVRNQSWGIPVLINTSSGFICFYYFNPYEQTPNLYPWYHPLPYSSTHFRNTRS